LSKGAKYDYEVDCHRRRDIGCLQTRITLLQALQGSHVGLNGTRGTKNICNVCQGGAQPARWQLVHCSVVHALLKQALLIAHFSMSLLCTAARASQRIANQGISHHGIVPTLHASPLASHRRQQLPTRRHVCSATEDGADLDQQLQADLERVRQRQATAAPSPAAQQATSAAQRAANSKGDGPLAGVKDAVDKVSLLKPDSHACSCVTQAVRKLYMLHGAWAQVSRLHHAACLSLELGFTYFRAFAMSCPTLCSC
jgi:hypothetical protein